METDYSIRLINAIGQQWPFLLVVFVIVLLIWNRKYLKSLVDNMTNVKLKYGDKELDITKKELKPTSSDKVEEMAIKPSEALTINSQIEATIKTTDEKGEFIGKINLHIENREFTEAKEVFKEWQSKEADNNTSVSNFYFFYYSLYIKGDINADEKILEKANEVTNINLKSEGFEYCGYAYMHTQAFKKAIYMFSLALDYNISEEKQSNIVGHLWECFYEEGDKEKAYSLLINWISKVKDDKYKALLLIKLSEYFDREEKNLERAFILDKAIELQPNNTDAIFSAAYSYSESSNPEMALLHYKNLLSLDKANATAWNNLGVTYEDLKLSVQSIDNYRKATELGMDLAAANLALRYIEVGFLEEAKSILTDLKNKQEIHPKVIAAFDLIANTKSEQEQLEKDLLKTGVTLQRVYRECAEAIIYKPDIDTLLRGKWKLYNSNLIPVIRVLNTKIEITWNNEENLKHKIIAVLFSNGYGHFMYTEPYNAPPMLSPLPSMLSPLPLSKPSESIVLHQERHGLICITNNNITCFITNNKSLEGTIKFIKS